jgi:hypothetical protein
MIDLPESNLFLAGDYMRETPMYSDRKVRQLIESAVEDFTKQLANAVQMLSDQDFEYNRKTNALIERHVQQLAERDKQNVLLRSWLRKIADAAEDGETKAYMAEDALAATADLSGLVLCDAEPVGWIDGSGFPKHPNWIQGIEERRQYGKAEPLFKARKP